MRSSQNPVISFPYLLLLALLFSSSSPTTLIQETCRKCSETNPNINYDFCTASFSSHPDGPHMADLRHLGLLSIRLTKHNVTSTRRFIKYISSEKRSKSFDAYVRACLRDCFVLYDDAVSTVKDAAKDYKKKRYDDANIAVSAVLDASTTCEDAFHARENDVVSPLTKKNNDTFHLSVIALSIINMLNK